MKFFAKTLPGLEDILRDELLSIGAASATSSLRGVEFEGDEELMYKALIHSRLALRILVPMTTGRVESEQDIYELTKTVPWFEHFRLSNTIAIDTVTTHPVMNHSVFLSQKTKDAVADVFRERFGERPNVDVKSPDVLIHLHLNAAGMASLYLDPSGRSLNQRGYRVDGWKAPLNEVLAAGLITLSGWDPETPFVDPMCGSGTLVIEAALIAKKKAPGLVKADFGLQRWPGFRKSLWQGLMMEARLQVRRDVDWIHGSDIEPGAIAAAKSNLSAASLMHNVRLGVAPVRHCRIPADAGHIVTNPPYGERIGDATGIQATYVDIRDMLFDRAHDYKASFITSDTSFRKIMGLKEDRRIALKNGPLDVEFITYTMYPKRG
jgi:putative N6-adenine-specific DNA methylase